MMQEQGGVVSLFGGGGPAVAAAPPVPKKYTSLMLSRPGIIRYYSLSQFNACG
jgi:hypothetical protein